MAVSVPLTETNRRLFGMVHKRDDFDGLFRFTCGFEIPLKHVEWAIGRTLQDGDKVSVELANPIIERRHSHEFKCSCGATHKGDSNR